MTKQLYADLWGTAYLDAAREEFRKILLKTKNLYLSESISPGFYGMSVEENIKICQILSGEKIGVSTNENGTMTPMKTCSGIYLAVDEPKYFLSADCKSCMGNPGGCIMCKLQGSV